MDCSENRTRPIRALEFYSGIGGLHLALCCSEVEGIVIRAFDWDQAARQVYKSNHGQGIVQQRDISTLSAQELVPLQANAWLLSPSCQPYTVLNPLAKGSEDPRAKSFIHLIEKVLPDLVEMGHEPKYLLVENVAGFETSSTRQRVLHLLNSLDYTTAEFLLTPLQFGIPNSRLRYYLLAKKKPLSFLGHEEGSVLRHIPGSGVGWVDPRTEDDDNPEASIDNIQCYTDPNTSFEEYKISDRVLEKWGRLFDIVLPSSRRTCCFTRGYTKLAERAGSVLQMNEKLDTTTTFVKFLSAQRNGDRDAVRLLDPLRLRYFSPDELLRLFSFVEPDGSSKSPSQTSFTWPATISNKTRYKLIGNSVNVTVVSRLIDYLFQ
ncbi:S-adenosyl-L-methionine-dependent methyltransferase [Irpex rosettiformis]|uniref:S-adenosyl-L-methionine-dependent methyltransferase n=1 Tax=Irpex rosettiformis TaxID=378272 RepID=A0ACB8U6H3_9APHY|nr:S-adenosyl-L-methionine-dependent methyltransferase [Irpex rosettiformis]